MLPWDQMERWLEHALKVGEVTYTVFESWYAESHRARTTTDIIAERVFANLGSQSHAKPPKPVTSDRPLIYQLQDGSWHVSGIERPYRSEREAEIVADAVALVRQLHKS